MKIEVKTQPSGRNYCVTIENSALSRAGEIIRPLIKNGAKVMIISETNVFPLYGKMLEASLHAEGISTARFIFEAGEESKRLDTVNEMYEALAENNMTRSDIIVTLGGGVAGDMGGYAAATYLRGIDYIQIPTTLLAQVDASVGGKTGVDTAFGKNLVGAFHQPLAVITDPLTLKTLPKKYIKDGTGEVIKYGCISDADLFARLEAGTAMENLSDVITRCVSSKKELVEIDSSDKGRRMILNFGHTFGHALEKLHDFKDLPHGMAVGIGMVIAAKLGENIGISKAGTAGRIIDVLEQYGLPVSDDFTAEEIIAATKLDKKSDGEKLNLILLKDIGEAVILNTTREEALGAMPH